MRYLLVSIGATAGAGLLIGLFAFLAVQAFEDMLLAFFCFGACPGLGLLAGLFWVRQQADAEPPTETPTTAL